MFKKHMYSYSAVYCCFFSLDFSQLRHTQLRRHLIITPLMLVAFALMESLLRFGVLMIIRTTQTRRYSFNSKVGIRVGILLFPVAVNGRIRAVVEIGFWNHSQ